MALDAGPRSPRPPDGTSRSTSARQAGSSVGRGRLDGRGAQPVRDRRQRQPARGAEALGARHDRALQPGQLGDLGDQAGLADAGAAAHQHQTGAARGGVCHRSWSRPSSPDRPTSCAAASPERPTWRGSAPAGARAGRSRVGQQALQRCVASPGPG